MPKHPFYVTSFVFIFINQLSCLVEWLFKHIPSRYQSFKLLTFWWSYPGPLLLRQIGWNSIGIRVWCDPIHVQRWNLITHPCLASTLFQLNWGVITSVSSLIQSLISVKPFSNTQQAYMMQWSSQSLNDGRFICGVPNSRFYIIVIIDLKKVNDCVK